MNLDRFQEAALRTPIYLDWNSTSPPHERVIEAMARAAQETWGNPASIHGVGRRAKHLVESVRELAAHCLGAHPRDVVFTSGGTEANNWALHEAPGIVLSRLEHPSVTKQAERLAAGGRPVQWLPVKRSGTIEPEDVRQSLVHMPRGTVVAVMAVNHETGIIQPIEEIGAVAHEFGAFMHVDAVQALGKLPLAAWNAWDTVAVAAHKIRGPKGIGALAWRAPRPIPTPLVVGGGQERGLRPGTVSPSLVAAFGAALDRLHEYGAGQPRLAQLRDRIERILSRLGIVEPNIQEGCPRLGHVSSLFVRSWPAEELVAALDLEGVCVSAGSACAAGSSEVSPVIESMLGSERARSTIRVSLGELTTEADVEAGLQAFHRVLSRS